MQSVVGAFKPQNLVATCGSASDANGVHGRFRSAVAEAHHLEGIAGADLFGQFQLHAVGHAEGRTTIGDTFPRLYDRGVPVTGHQGAETKFVIEIFVTVDVLDLAAMTLGDKNRIRIISPLVAGDSEGNAFWRFLMRFGRFRRALLV